jgi:hypothetical protein
VGPDYANAPDVELISAGNADAFAVVYDRHAAAVYRWARARVGDHAADQTYEYLPATPANQALLRG